MRTAAALAAALGLWLAACIQAGAHTRDQIFSTWQVREGSVAVTIRMPARLAAQTRGNGQTGDQASHFLRTLNVSLDSAPCRGLQRGVGRDLRQGMLMLDLVWTCPAAAGTGNERKLTLQVNALFGRFPDHVHFARLRLPGGRLEELLFTRAHRTHEIPLQSEDGDVTQSWIGQIADYMGLGVTHILGGADHLAFIMGLILIASGLRSLLFIITGFTLGHSVTLALAATGAVTPVDAVVEALIGFTVAIVAVEAASRHSRGIVPLASVTIALCVLALAGFVFGSALPMLTWTGLVIFAAAYLLLSQRPDGRSWAVALATVFGLVHGFGFAGVLQEAGLPDDRLVSALLGFNIGVEAGQILIVLLALAAARGAAQLMPEPARITGAWMLAGLLCGLGTFWFVSRAFAG